MPTYEYLCSSCKHRFSTVQSIKEDPLVDCPGCQHKALKRVIFPVGVLKSGSSRRLSEEAARRQEPDRMKLAYSKPEKFDELLVRERDVGGRLPVETVD